MGNRSTSAVNLKANSVLTVISGRQYDGHHCVQAWRLGSLAYYQVSC